MTLARFKYSFYGGFLSKERVRKSFNSYKRHTACCFVASDIDTFYI